MMPEVSPSQAFPQNQSHRCDRFGPADARGQTFVLQAHAVAIYSPSHTCYSYGETVQGSQVSSRAVPSVVVMAEGATHHVQLRILDLSSEGMMS